MAYRTNASFAVLLSVLFFLVSPFGVSAKPWDVLPTWPITNIGDPIPDGLIKYWAGGVSGSIRIGERCRGLPGAYHSFPAKAHVKGQLDHPDDPNKNCGDGDQTAYNGYLCAVGFSNACRAVAEAQDHTGRFFRSPHRAWVWNNLCFKDGADAAWVEKNHDNWFLARCANGFSPDMNLGVLFYALATQDRARYKKWLDWLDNHASTTELCTAKGNGEIDFDDCRKVDWPRFCPQDLGFKDEKGEYNHGVAITIIDGKPRYGGRCSFRPNDALDFAAVNDALFVAAPPRLNSFEVRSRAILGAAEGLSPLPVPKGVASEFMILSSITVDKKFSLHLDALRVLLRMMIKNPSLKMNNLPEFPDPAALKPNLLDALSSDGTDPLTIHIAAETIANRHPDNALYRLLADGPTPEVRDHIMRRCPAISNDDERDNGNSEHGNHWIWEKEPTSPDTLPVHSMGWDCAFTGALYNKMRVRKDLVDELLDTFLVYADPLNSVLQDASEALQLAEAAYGVQRQVVDEAERALNKALDFVNEGHAALRREAVNAARAADAAIRDLNSREAKLRKEVDGIVKKIDDIFCPDWVPLCSALKDAKNKLTNARNTLQQTVRDLAEENLKLESMTKAVTDLDARLQKQKDLLDRGILKASADAARLDLQLKTDALQGAREALVEVRRQHAAIVGRLAIWRDDEQTVIDITETPDIADLPETVSGATEGDNDVSENLEVDVGSYYSIVGSFRTSKGAFRHLLDLSERDGKLKLDVYLPYIGSPYWVVTSSPNTSLEAAKKHANFARSSRFQRDAYVLNLPNAVQ